MCDSPSAHSGRRGPYSCTVSTGPSNTLFLKGKREMRYKVPAELEKSLFSNNPRATCVRVVRCAVVDSVSESRSVVIAFDFEALRIFSFMEAPFPLPVALYTLFPVVCEAIIFEKHVVERAAGHPYVVKYLESMQSNASFENAPSRK